MQPDITLCRSDLERLQRTLLALDERTPPLMIERLETELVRAQVVEAAAPDVVTLGSRVTFLTRETGRTRHIRLVLPEDVEGRDDLSVLTPIGCSLLGLRRGDVFTWQDAGRSWHLEVCAVEQP
ncbi:MAG: GreA/GreB family elongation factor [Myxococcota bacterium]